MFTIDSYLTRQRRSSLQTADVLDRLFMGKSFWTSQRSSWRAWVTCYESCRLTGHSQETFLMNTKKQPSFCFVFFFQLQSIDFQQSHLLVDVGRSGDNIELVFFFCLSCSNDATLAIFLRSSYFIYERTLFFRKVQVGFRVDELMKNTSHCVARRMR